MAQVTIILSDNDSLKCGFSAQAFTGEAVNPGNPSKSHILATHIMQWLKKEEEAAAVVPPAPVAVPEEPGESCAVEEETIQ